MSKHTPGPWRAYCRDIGYVEGTEWSEDEFLQWEVEGPEEPIGRGSFFQGDARLIAAAPELLDACKKALYALKGREHDQFLRDAIAKAEGA
ncbi:hypothetical protein IP84_16900 [beta proteobacterium AAP99]|nr:hypothetical protein IP84_16900 [beta proteobacterium AAP99]